MEVDEVSIEDYSCPNPEVDQNGTFQTFINMSSNFASIIEAFGKGRTPPTLKLISENVASFGKIIAIFGENYDGGDFCKGLLFTVQASNVAKTISDFQT